MASVIDVPLCRWSPTLLDLLIPKPICHLSSWSKEAESGWFGIAVPNITRRSLRPEKSFTFAAPI